MPAKTAQETLSLEQLSFAAVSSVPVQYDWGQEPEWETVFLPGAARQEDREDGKG